MAFWYKHFLRNASFGSQLTVLKKTIDVHLMIVDPDRYIKTFAELGQYLSVHYEACTSSQNATNHQSREG
jgi:pentose-5-phosphate-3-epimerase